jgi:hypothetical protein
MVSKKKLGMVAAALVAIGTAIGVTALTGGAAHAQSASSIAITGMAQGGTITNPYPEVLVYLRRTGLSRSDNVGWQRAI